MNRINKIGTSYEPCGIPYSKLFSFEDVSLLETYCFILLRCEVNKDNIVPLKPY